MKDRDVVVLFSLVTFSASVGVYLDSAAAALIALTLPIVVQETIDGLRR